MSHPRETAEAAERDEATGHRVELSGDRATSRWALAWVIGTIACVFGPYLAAGLRTEQLAIYGSAVVAVVVWRTDLVRALSAGWVVVALWAAYAATASVGAVFIESRLPWGSGSLIAGLDNALLPLATMIVVAAWTRLLPVPVLIRTASWTIVGAMAVNGVIALAMSLFGYVGEGTTPLRRFWAASGGGDTVAELAAGNGRYSGVFNQPAEAGIAYCLAAFCLIYLVRSGTRVPRKVWVLAWVLLVLGALMTLSKIPIVGGVFVAGVLILTRRHHRVLLSASAAGTVLTALVVGAVGWLGTWGASGMLKWYVESADSGASWIFTLSAGRFGRGPSEGGPDIGKDDVPDEFERPGGLIELGKEVLDLHPWFGLGADGAPVSYDSTWIEAIIVAGSVGLFLMVSLHLVLLVRCLRLRGTLGPEEWRLAAAVVVLTWGSSFGMPSLSGNRESSLMWVMLCLLIVYRARDCARDQARPAGVGKRGARAEEQLR